MTDTQMDLITEREDDRPGCPLDGSWHYLHARLEDGHGVWMSPFWVDLPRKS